MDGSDLPIRYDSGGLVPAIAQQHDTGEVLMMAWMNADSVAETLATGRVCYWSRSRAAPWRKGEKSGRSLPHWPAELLPPRRAGGLFGDHQRAGRRPCGAVRRRRLSAARRLAAAGLGAIALLAWRPIAQAATPERAHRVLAMVYDIGLYQAELDRVMDEAASKGVYGGVGSTVASRARDRSRTRVTMVADREAVLDR